MSRAGTAFLGAFRWLERHLRVHSYRIASFATRLNRMSFYAFDLVFWSRIIRSSQSPIPVEIPIEILRKKNIDHLAPILNVSGVNDEVAHWDDGFAGIYSVLFENLQNPDVLSTVRYGHPAPAFRGIYLWDSAFIAQIWKTWDRAAAHDVASAVILVKEEDRFQHVVSDLISSGYTQPPLIAWSLEGIWKHAGRDEAVEALTPHYQALVDYNRWLYRNRRLQNGLFYWLHPYESGVENAPRFGSADEAKQFDTTGIAAPDLCTYIILQNEAIANISEWLGLDGSEFEEKATELRSLVQSQLFCEKDGVFYDRREESGEFLRSLTIGSILPLWAGAATPEQASSVRDHIMSEDHFNTLIPFPTVSMSDPDFSRDMWRGPVWINLAYGTIQGLNRYGFENEASELAFKLCDGVYRVFNHERKFYEFYDPTSHHTRDLDRKKGNRWKALTLGTGPQKSFVGWTGLVNTLVVEQLFGYRVSNGKHRVEPRFPRQAVGKAYSLRIPRSSLAIDAAILDTDRFRLSLRGPDNKFLEREVGFGEAVEFWDAKEGIKENAIL